MTGARDPGSDSPQRLLLSDPRTGQLVQRRWKLEVLSGADRGRTVVLESSPAVLGAAPAAALVLTDDTVSRYHLELDLFADGLHLRDLDSTNGTFVNGARVKEAFVGAEGCFSLGQTELRAIGLDVPVSLAPPPEGTLRVRDALAASTSMKRIFGALELLAHSPSAVLLVGEPGAGRAECARLLHELGPRREAPFVRHRFEPGLSPEAADAICFGVGSDPSHARPGLLQRADGGTLLLEGVEHLPEATQRRLQQALASGELRAEGETARRRADVRVVTSLRKDLVRRSGLLPGLWARLAVVRIDVPSLAERRDDIIPLAQHFVLEAGSRVSLGPELSRLLLAETWMGNVDELRDAIRWILFPEEGSPAEREALREVFVFETVELLGGDVSRAAKNLDLAALELWRYLGRRNHPLEGL